MKKILILFIILLFIPIVYGTVEFNKHTIGGIGDVTGSDTFDIIDLDNDGFLDVITESADSIVWLENNGQMGFLSSVNLSWNFPSINEILVDDFNNDGVTDYIMSAKSGGYSLLGYGGGGFPFPLQEFVYYKTGVSGCSPVGIAYGDIDNDYYGDTDFVIGCSNTPANENIIYVENTCDDVCTSTFTGDHYINHTVKASDGNDVQWKVMKLFDLDNDGDLDIVAGGNSVTLGTINWYENEGGGLSWTEHVIQAGYNCHDLEILDFDNDGDFDVLSASDDNVSMSRNDGNEDFTTYKLYSTATANILNVDYGDVNNDEYDDFFFVDENDNTLRVIENVFGATYPQLIETLTNPSDLDVVDFDLDGFVDVVVTDSNQLYWFENELGATTECAVFPTLFCDEFDYITTMSEKGWIIQIDGGSVNNTFTPKDDMMVLNTTQIILPYHETDTFPTSFRPDGSSAFTQHYLSPVFSSEFDLFMYNKSTNDNQFGYLMSEKQFKPVFWIEADQTAGNGTGNINWYYVNSTSPPSVTRELICGNCSTTETILKVKINSYFTQRESYPFNSSVEQDTVELYVNNVLLGTVTDGFIDADRVEYISQYEFIKNMDDSYTIDDYYVMVGTDKDTSTFEQYYTDFYENKTVEEIVLGDGSTGDMATALGTIWDDFGLQSIASRIMAGLFLMFLLAILMFGIAMSQHTPLSPAVFILVELFFMILLTYIRLLPIWLPFVVVILSAGVGALIVKTATG